MATIEITTRIPASPDAVPRPDSPLVAPVRRAGREDAVQRVADATVWLLFRVSGVRS